MINDLLKNLAIAFNEPGAQNFVARDDSLQRALDTFVAKIANQFPLNSKITYKVFRTFDRDGGSFQTG